MNEAGDMKNGKKAFQLGKLQPVSNFIGKFSDEVDWPRDPDGTRKRSQLAEALGIVPSTEYFTVGETPSASWETENNYSGLTAKVVRVEPEYWRRRQLSETVAVLFSAGRNSENIRNTLLLTARLSEWWAELSAHNYMEEGSKLLRSTALLVRQALIQLVDAIEEHNCECAGELLREEEIALVRAIGASCRLPGFEPDGYDNVCSDSELSEARTYFLRHDCGSSRVLWYHDDSLPVV